MRKPLFTKPINLNSRSKLVRSLQWNLQKRFLVEIGPLQFQLDLLQDTVRDLVSLTQRRTLSMSDDLRHMDNIFHKDLVKLSIAYAIALLIVSLGCLIGFLVN